MSEHVRSTFDWAVEAVERHPVHGYTNPSRRIEIAQELTRLVIELERLLVDPESTGGTTEEQ